EIIIRGGVNIAPPEIDAILHEIEGVAEAAAAGVPDKIWGEEVAAFLVCPADSKIKTDDVLAHCRSRLPEAKAPKSVVLMTELPRNARGKVDRAALTTAWIARQAAAGRGE
ncbi:MAG: hypothetical protein AB7O43_10260, partial [Hyphomicrobiaceae bacterium]